MCFYKLKELQGLIFKDKGSIVRLNTLICLLIIGGFSLAIFSSYISFNQLFKADIEAVSELTSENIYSNINNLLDRPINVSLAMAHDTLLEDLMEQEAEEGVTPAMTDRIRNYLLAYRDKYGFDSVTLTSVKTGVHYHFKEGVGRTMSLQNPEDDWYYKFLKEDMECKLNIDNDKISNYDITVFADSKIVDSNGNTVGVVGVGMQTPRIQELLLNNEDQYDLRTYLIDYSGNVQLSSRLTTLENVNLFDNKIFSGMAESIRRNNLQTKWYSDGKVDGYVITRYIPNLNWYLVVEKNTAELQHTMVRVLSAGFLFMLIVVVVVVLITTHILKNYHSALVGQAQRDPLTGIRNRYSYEQEMKVYGGRLSDYQHFGIGIFDLNDLKYINDSKGHQAGDKHLKEFTLKLCSVFSHCPVFRIGGDEFLTVFLNIEQGQVEKKWQILKNDLENSLDGTPISVAFGYAFRSEMEDCVCDDIEAIFHKADCRMYEDKQKCKSENPDVVSTTLA